MFSANVYMFGCMYPPSIPIHCNKKDAVIRCIVRLQFYDIEHMMKTLMLSDCDEKRVSNILEMSMLFNHSFVLSEFVKKFWLFISGKNS